MVALNPAYAPRKSIDAAKNRVGDFFCESVDRVGLNRLSVQQPRLENELTFTITASGLPFFINADPIGFSGGMNWFAYASANPISRIDPQGTADGGSTIVGADSGFSSPFSSTEIDYFNANGHMYTGPTVYISQDVGANLVGEIAAEFTPVGVVLAGKDFIENPSKLALAGLLPGIPRAGLIDDIAASAPVGRLGNPINISKGTNAAGEVGGRQYSGHAFDQMQSRGVPPSAVENTIVRRTPKADPLPDRMRHYDSVNDLTVVTDIETGRVITVITGER